MNNNFYEKIVIKFSGDSGDGIQLLGNQFTDSSILTSKNDIYTFVDFPPEIRAPAGSINGVSSYQLSISSKKIYSIDNEIDILIAFNPAALKKNIKFLKNNGMLIIDSDNFDNKNLIKADLEESYFKNINTIKIPITNLTFNSVKNIITSVSKAKRCKNFFTLGLISWIFNRKIDDIIINLKNKFKYNTDLYTANKLALIAGYNYADITELLVNKIIIPPFINNNKQNLIKISGNKAFALGALTSSIIFKLPLFSANYPITPASEILHILSLYINENIKIIQLEDEIACINAVIGAAYGGSLSFTCTSGPGLDLMQEGIGLSIMARLPILLINIQRCGPSTGIPTKSEQTDLLAALFGRHGEAKVVVLAPTSPSDCFWSIIEGFCLAISYLGPVIILSDSNLANSFELWEKPDENIIQEKIKFDFNLLKQKNINFNNNTSIDIFKSWIVPGKINNEICIGGLERNIDTNDVSHDSENHEKMTFLRNKHLQNVAKLYKNLDLTGHASGNILLITWGSVCGLLKTIYNDIINNTNNKNISLLCIKYIYPCHKNLKKLLFNFKKIIIIEENLGQLKFLLKSIYKINVISINSVSGIPFNTHFLKDKINKIIQKYDSRK